MPAQRQLNEDVDLLLIEPLLVRRHHARPRPAAAALHLTALHGQVDLVAARIAGHDLELGAERAVEYFGELVGIRGCPGTADDEVLLHDLLKLGDPGRVPGDTNADLG